MTTPAIACTLTPDTYADRVRWIADLNRAFLRSYAQHDRMLDLVYAPDAAQPVHALVHRERLCCAFLRFTVHQSVDTVRLGIEAPVAAGDEVDLLFAPFLEGAQQATARDP